MIGAIDIGGTKIALGIFDESGKLWEKRVLPTQAISGPMPTVLRVANVFREIVFHTGTQLEGIGIGCTGPVYPKPGTVGNTEFLPGWEGFSLVEAVETALETRAYLENDADAAALGEWAWGVGAGSSSFLLVTIGTGIGAGIILDGNLYRGVNGAHPEVGHHFIDPNGPACACGGNGCWESLASGPSMETWAREHHPDKKQRTARELCRAAEDGDEIAIQVIEREAYYLGLGVANMVTSYTPDIIALTGGVMRSHHLFVPTICSMVARMTGYVPHGQVQIVAVPENADAGLRGAAQVWLQHRSK
jgi:glucokinase